MAFLLDIISWGLLIAGSFFLVTSGIGMVRALPDVFARMHAASLADTLGADLIVLGLYFQAGTTLVTVKLVLVLLLLFFTSPTSTHALAKAALHSGLRPNAERLQVDGEEER